VFELNQFVKPLDCEKVVTEVELRKIMSDLSNSPLPHNHLANWEIFLGPKIVYDEKIHQAIICRLHHSLGDGPALFRTLLSSLASSEDQNLFTRDNKIFARPPVSKNKRRVKLNFCRHKKLIQFIKISMKHFFLINFKSFKFKCSN